MDEDHHNRKYPRLKGYDYAMPGAYFATICTENRSHLLARVANAGIELTRLGQLAEEEWRALPALFPHCALMDYVVMPNHLHGILVLQPRPTASAQPTAGTRAGSLGALIQAYKSRVTRLARLAGLCAGAVWQRGYYEHVVRNDGDLELIQEYIANNPLCWCLDQENQLRSGINPFYQQLAEGGRSMASPLQIHDVGGRSMASPLRTRDTNGRSMASPLPPEERV